MEIEFILIFLNGLRRSTYNSDSYDMVSALKGGFYFILFFIFYFFHFYSRIILNLSSPGWYVGV